jgi:hypothetical protein
LGLQNTLIILDVETMKWKRQLKAGDIPNPLYSPTMQYYDGCLFLAGGVDLTNPNSANWYYNTNFYKYNLTEQKWYDISNPAGTYEHRSLTGSALYNSEFILFYGWSDLIGDDISEISSVDLDDPDYAWNVIDVNYDDTSVVLPRDSYAFVTLNQSFYIFSGYSYLSGNLNDLIVFDLS